MEKIEEVIEEYKEIKEEKEQIELMKWETMRDIGYAIKRMFGFKFLGWFRPKGYDYGYFIDPLTVVCKYRDENRTIHTFMQTFPESEGVDILKK
jgi:hypothetical protein